MKFVAPWKLKRVFETFIRAEVLHSSSSPDSGLARLSPTLFFLSSGLHNLLHERAAPGELLHETLLAFSQLDILRDESLAGIPARRGGVPNYVASIGGFAADLELAFLSRPRRSELPFFAQT